MRGGEKMSKTKKVWQTFSWDCYINDKAYGNKCKINLANPQREQITQCVRVIAKQINLSLQKILTGKHADEIMAKFAKKHYKLARELSAEKYQITIEKDKNYLEKIRI